MECPTCGKTLSTAHGMRQHHTNVHGEPLPNRTCRECGLEFYDPKARRTFCEDCNPNAGKHNGNWSDAMETTSCKRCGEAFDYYPSNKDGKYCSSCVDESADFRGTPSYEIHDVERTKQVCEFCGRIITVLQSRADRYPVRFCSQHCHALSLTEQWGPSKNVYTGRWRETRRQALARDDHRCQHCGITAEEIGHEPAVHHLIPVREFEYPQRVHTLDNVICLCRSCHRLVEIGSIDISLTDANNNS